MNRQDKAFLKQVKELVYQQMKEHHVNCDTVSESMNISNQQLRRKILEITSITGAVYILGIRMDYAKQLLAKNRYPIAKVALKCGYEDSNNFSRTFKRVVGLTPSEYEHSQKADQK